MKKFLKKTFWPSILLTIVVLIKNEQHAWAYTLFSFVVIVLAIMLYINSNEKFYQNVLEKSEVHVSQIEKLLNITKKPTPGMYTTSSGDNISFLYKRLSIIEDELRQINATNLSTCKPNKSFVKASDRNPVFMSKITASKYISRMDNVRFDRGMNMVQNLHLPCKISCDITSSRSHHITYKTTLTSCTCPDFDNEKEPCKHMIALALMVGALAPKDNSVIVQVRELKNENDRLNEEKEKLEKDNQRLNNKLAALTYADYLLSKAAERENLLLDEGMTKKYLERFASERFMKALDIKDKIPSYNPQLSCVVPSSTNPNQEPYKTNLTNCSCYDFRRKENSKKQLPCKHMIALAIAIKALVPTNEQFEQVINTIAANQAKCDMDIDEGKKLKKEAEDKLNKANDKLNIVNEKTLEYPYLASLIADYELSQKHITVRKAVDKDKLTKENTKLTKKCQELNNRIKAYHGLYPELEAMDADMLQQAIKKKQALS